MGQAMTEKQEIENIIRQIGPAVPGDIAPKLNINIIVSGALMSEMVSEGRLKITRLKVGGSPLYYLGGQDELLWNFSNKLNIIEQKACTILKEKKVLKSSELSPVERVALANAPDFAKQMTIETEKEAGKTKEPYWRWHLTTEEEARKIISGVAEQISKQEKEKEKVQEIIHKEKTGTTEQTAEQKSKLKTELETWLEENIVAQNEEKREKPSNNIEITTVSVAEQKTGEETEEENWEENEKEKDKIKNKGKEAEKKVIGINSEMKIEEIKEKTEDKKKRKKQAKQTQNEKTEEQNDKIKEKTKEEKEKGVGNGESGEPKKENESDEFLKTVEKYFADRKISVIEKIIVKKSSEIDFVISVPSAIGDIMYYCKAKNKSKCTDGELGTALIAGQKKNLPIFFMCKNRITKKASEMISRDFRNITVAFLSELE